MTNSTTAACFRLSTFLLALLTLLQTTARGQQPANTVLFLVDTASTGDLQSPFKNFYYHDVSLRGHPIHFATDSFLVNIDHPFFLLQANEAQNPYLIFPGETIHLKTLHSGEAYLSIPGNPRRTRELNFFTELVRQTGNLSYAFKLPVFVKKVNTLAQLQQYETMIGDTWNARMRLLNEQAKSQSFSQEFITMATSSIHSAAFRDSVELYAFNKEFLQARQRWQQTMASKTRSMENIPLTSLRYDLQAINDLANVLAAGNVRYINYGPKEFEQLYQTVNRSFTGQYREYLLFKTLYEAACRYIEIPKPYLDKFYNDSKNSLHRSMMEYRISESAGLAATQDDMLVDETGQQTTLAAVLKKHIGKLVLLDFWASWCAPCRDEMKYSKALLKQYADKPVIFLYLSIDENKKAWKTAMQQENLATNSYLFLTPARAKIMTEQQVMGIPRYMLINKAGKFVSYDAPRPSDSLLVSLIEKHL